MTPGNPADIYQRLAEAFSFSRSTFCFVQLLACSLARCSRLQRVRNNFWFTHRTAANSERRSCSFILSCTPMEQQGADGLSHAAVLARSSCRVLLSFRALALATSVPLRRSELTLLANELAAQHAHAELAECLRNVPALPSALRAPPLFARRLASRRQRQVQAQDSPGICCGLSWLRSSRRQRVPRNRSVTARHSGVSRL